MRVFASPTGAAAASAVAAAATTAIHKQAPGASRRPRALAPPRPPGPLAFLFLAVLLLAALGPAAAQPAISWPPTSGTALPAGAGGAVFVYGSSLGFDVNAYTLSAPGYSSLTPTWALSTQLAFSFGAAAVGPAGTTNMWTLTHVPTSTVLLQFPVVSTAMSLALPYARSVQLPVSINNLGSGPIAATLLLKRMDQNYVYMALQSPFSFPSGNGQPGLTSVALPADFRPITTQRCYAHTVVNGVAVELHIDVQDGDGLVRFTSSVSGAGWTTSGASYFNGCGWIAKN